MTQFDLLELLRDAGVPDKWSWDRIAVVENTGPIRPTHFVPGDHAWNRGFNMVLYATDGRPRYFCKCRPAHHEGFLHEMELTRTLSSDPSLGGVIPATLTARNESVLLQVSEYLPGGSMAARLPKMTEQAWEAAMLQMLDLNRRIVRVAEVLLRPSPANQRINLADAAKPALEYLERAIGTSKGLGALGEAAAEAGEVPGQVQHGDFWPGNMIWSRGSWHLLDLEYFGVIRVPLYDALHFVRTCWDQRHASITAARGQPWLRRMQIEVGPAEIASRLLSHELRENQLEMRQLPGLLAYYLLDITHRHHLRGYYYDRLVAEVLAFASMLGDRHHAWPFKEVSPTAA